MKKTQVIQAYLQDDSVFIKLHKSIIKYLTYIFIYVHIFGRQLKEAERNSQVDSEILAMFSFLN